MINNQVKGLDLSKTPANDLSTLVVGLLNIKSIVWVEIMFSLIAMFLLLYLGLTNIGRQFKTFYKMFGGSYSFLAIIPPP